MGGGRERWLAIQRVSIDLLGINFLNTNSTRIIERRFSRNVGWAIGTPADRIVSLCFRFNLSISEKASGRATC